MPTPIRAASGFARRFPLEALSVSLAVTTQEETFPELAKLLVRSGQITARQTKPLIAQFAAREKLASTGVGAGVAIPHVKLEGLRATALAMAVLPGGVPWSAVDGDPVQIVFAVVRPAEAGPAHDPKRHLELMQWIAGLARARDFRRFALAARTAEELSELLLESESA